MTGLEEQGRQESPAEQLEFIEKMMLEGRRTTEYWGWNFVLWGFSYLVAMALEYWVKGQASYWVWPVMMTGTGVATGVIARWRNGNNPMTTKSRAITNVWMAVGFGIIVFTFPTIISHRFADGHTFMAAIEILLGVAHLASGLLLRWRLQAAVGLSWWVLSLITTFTQSSMGLLVPFLTGTFLLNICFGGYLMYMEARDKARLRAGQVVHA